MNGKTYKGHFEVFGGVLTVTAAYGQKATQVGQMLPTVLAAMLLRELICERKGRRGPKV